MAKVTSKLQVTIPRKLAQQFGIQPGDEIDWSSSGDGIRITPADTKSAQAERLPLESRLKLFDQATERQKKRQRNRPAQTTGRGRGWTREDLYTRGRTR